MRARQQAYVFIRLAVCVVYYFRDLKNLSDSECTKEMIYVRLRLKHIIAALTALDQ